MSIKLECPDCGLNYLPLDVKCLHRANGAIIEVVYPTRVECQGCGVRYTVYANAALTTDVSLGKPQ